MKNLYLQSVMWFEIQKDFLLFYFYSVGFDPYSACQFFFKKYAIQNAFHSDICFEI
jgi:hypothetical protein